MSRFGRKETFIASHYTHSDAGAPRAFHPIQPLTWGTYMAYGAQPYGLSLYSIVAGRTTRTNLEKTKANVSSYDHYDAVQTLVKQGGSIKKAEIAPAYASFTTIASNDAAALLKTAYWLALAGSALKSTTLKQAAQSQSETGLTDGIVAGAANRRDNIVSTYAAALDLIRSNYTGSPKNAAVESVIVQLQKGSPEAVKARTSQTDSYAASKKEAEAGASSCKNTWKANVPGLCAAEEAGTMYILAAKIVGGVVLAGAAIWGVKQLVRQVRSNPSSLGNMTNSPEMDIAALPEAKKQELTLITTAFRRRSR
jgi:hypothetical protein